jgi:hypothetical protein
MSLESVESFHPVYIKKMPRNKENPFGQASQKILYSKSLSCTEKGFLGVILAMDQTKPITVKNLKKNLKECPDTIRSYLERLEVLKFVEKKALVEQRGFFPEYHYVINEFAVMKLSDRTFSERLKERKKATTKTNKDSKVKMPDRDQSDRKPSYPLLNKQENNINNNDDKKENIISISQKISERKDLDEFLFNLVENNLATNREINKWKTIHGPVKIKNVFDNWEAIKAYSMGEGYTEQESFHYLKLILNGDGKIPAKVRKQVESVKQSEINQVKETELSKWSKVWDILDIVTGSNTHDAKINFTLAFLSQAVNFENNISGEKIKKILNLVTKTDIENQVNEVLTSKDFINDRVYNNNLNKYTRAHVETCQGAIKTYLEAVI